MGATAGDDQRIALTIIGFERANSGQTCLQMLSCRHFDNAHTSSVRAVCWAHPWLLSVGLDRRLRVWDVVAETDVTAEDTRLEQAGEPWVVKCTEPTALVAAEPSASSDERRWPLIVAGRGVELATLCWK